MWNHLMGLLSSAFPDVIRALETALAAVIVAVFGGAALSRRWYIAQKRAELSLAAAGQFYQAYGEFFAVWKLWTQLHRTSPPSDTYEADRSALVQRAAGAEAMMESLYVRLALGSGLQERDAEYIGRFRQGFQKLRKQIQADAFLNWYSSNHPEYLTFKALACRVATIFEGRPRAGARRAYERLIVITSNHWEERNQSWVLNMDPLDERRLLERVRTRPLAKDDMTSTELGSQSQ